MPKKFLTVKEVSRLFGVTPLTIRNWDKKGKLVAYRHPVNNYRLYKTEDIEKMMKDLEESKGRAQQIETAQSPTEEEEKPKGPKKLEIDIL